MTLITLSVHKRATGNGGDIYIYIYMFFVVNRTAHKNTVRRYMFFR